MTNGFKTMWGSLFALSLFAVPLPSPAAARADSARLESRGDSARLEAPCGSSREKTSGGFISKVSSYFQQTNKPSDKKFDMSLVVGPSYDATTSVSIGGVACGVYSWDRSDPGLRKSDVSIFGNISVTGLAAVGVEGHNFLPRDRWRINYELSAQHKPMHLWGVGYTMGDNHKNYGEYSRIYVSFKPEFLYRIGRNLYLGPAVDIDFNHVYRMDRKPDGTMPRDYDGVCLGRDIFTAAIGVCLAYDSRDYVTCPTRGVVLRFQSHYYPAWMQTGNDFATSEVTLSFYHKAWRGAVFAYDIHGLNTYGFVPWTRLAQVGGSYRMRGYYIGQYRDENVGEAQFEVRQHIYGRSGCVLWVGCGNVWGRERFSWRHTLPNCGVGYRWELKQHSNIRVDLGFTKHDFNVCFNINEAF